MINSPFTRIDSPVVADQSGCPNEAAAAVAVTGAAAEAVSTQTITVMGSKAAVGLVVTPTPPGTSNISNATFGPITFKDAFADPNGLRVDAAFAAAVGANVSAKDLSLVLMPRLGAGNLTFNPAAPPKSIKDLSSTLAEMGTGVLRELFPVLPSAGHSTTAIFVALIIVVAASASAAVIELRQLSKKRSRGPVVPDAKPTPPAGETKQKPEPSKATTTTDMRQRHVRFL
jgi:hypothetical protein